MSIVGIGANFGGSGSQEVQGTYTFNYREENYRKTTASFEADNGQSFSFQQQSASVEVSQISITLSGEEAELQELFAQLDAVFRDAAERAFTSDEEDFLDALEGEIEDILDEQPPASGNIFDNVPQAVLDQVEAAYEAIDLLNEAAQNGFLSEKQLEELDKAEDQIDDLLAAFDAPDDADFAGSAGISVASGAYQSALAAYSI